jgi:predicted nucleic acid-binding protein
MNPDSVDQIKAAAVDTGIIIEYLSLRKEKTEEQKFLEQLETTILESEKYRVLYIPAIVKTELLYITCRLKGWNESQTIINDLLANFVVLRIPDLDEIAASIKCRVPIALADCYTLAVGKYLSIPAYFIKEQELTPENQEILTKELSVDLKVIERPKLT